MKKLVVTTNLVGKDEQFKALAVAIATRLPILFIGPAGTGKTNIILDFGKALLAYDAEERAAAGDTSVATTDYHKAFFMLETDDQTKASEVKGRPDMKGLMLDGEFRWNTPLARAKYVLINEVDKASSAVRNSLLGVMNEKIIMQGDEIFPCSWELFAASCNKITDEDNIPFWDRFVIKIHSTTMSAEELAFYLQNGDHDFSQEIEINIPTQAEIAAVSISHEDILKAVQVMRSSKMPGQADISKYSDRTITHLRKVAAVISLVDELPQDEALVRAVKLITQDDQLVRNVSAQIINQTLSSVRTKIMLFSKSPSLEGLKSSYEDCKSMVAVALQNKKITSAQESQLRSDMDTQYSQCVASLNQVEIID